ncbi:MAG: type II secretion system F family protein [Halanaerobiaceae bacterium]
MPQYEYRAINQVGEEVEGTIQAEEEREATKKVENRGLHLFSLRERENKSGGFFSRVTGGGNDLLMFTRQLSNLLQSGVQLGDALKVIADIFRSSGEFQNIIKNIYSYLKEGKSFAEALSSYPEYFPASYISMIRAGEDSGFLPETCRRIADNLKSNRELKAFIISSLIYPIIMLLVAVVAVIIMLVFVLPRFVKIYDTYEQSLPFITEVLLSVSNFIYAYGLYLLGGIGLTVILLSLYFNSDQGRKFKDNLMLRIPVLRVLIESLMVNRLANSLGNMLNNGVPLLKGLKISREVVNNTRYKQALQEITLRVERGGSLAEAMGGYDLFPELVVYMIGVGEQTGNLAEMMSQIADQYREEYQNNLERLMKLFEPLLILVIGSVVAVIVIAMLLPVLTLNTIQF